MSSTLVELKHLQGAAQQQGADVLYEQALAAARQQNYDEGAQRFEQLISKYPGHTKGWISYAQMTKKSAKRISTEAGADACRSVLQRGSEVNPLDGQLMQARGLLELQQGRGDLALPLLQRAVALKPQLEPVLHWKAVQEAMQQVGCSSIGKA